MQVTACLAALLFLIPASDAADLPGALRTVYKIGVSQAEGSNVSGSAVLVAAGKLVTSCHTTHNAHRILVLHPAGELSAEPGPADRRHDLCVVIVPEVRGPVAVRHPSSELRLGETVVAVGFGIGFSRFVQEGRITALYQMDGGRVIRTSTVFPRGASGGGLFTTAGELVGILTFRGTVGEELNYAVPMEWVDPLLEAGASGVSTSAEDLSFWEDNADQQPPFLNAAWLESAQEWNRLAEIALDWTLSVPEEPEAWFALGRAKLALGQPKEAVLALRTAVAHDGRHIRAWYWLAIAYQKIGFPSDFVYAASKLEALDERQAADLMQWTSRKIP